MDYDYYWVGCWVGITSGNETSLPKQKTYRKDPTIREIAEQILVRGPQTEEAIARCITERLGTTIEPDTVNGVLKLYDKIFVKIRDQNTERWALKVHDHWAKLKMDGCKLTIHVEIPEPYLTEIIKTCITKTSVIKFESGCREARAIIGQIASKLKCEFKS